MDRVFRFGCDAHASQNMARGGNTALRRVTVDGLKLPIVRLSAKRARKICESPSMRQEHLLSWLQVAE
jgi:hypothetical protein